MTSLAVREWCVLTSKLTTKYPLAPRTPSLQERSALEFFLLADIMENSQSHRGKLGPKTSHDSELLSERPDCKDDDCLPKPAVDGGSRTMSIGSSDEESSDEDLVQQAKYDETCCSRGQTGVG